MTNPFMTGIQILKKEGYTAQPRGENDAQTIRISAVKTRVIRVDDVDVLQRVELALDYNRKTNRWSGVSPVAGELAMKLNGANKG